MTGEIALMDGKNVPKTKRGKARTAKNPMKVKTSERRISMGFIFLIDTNIPIQSIATEIPKKIKVGS